MQFLLRSCEEGATDELHDGSNGDRRASRATAEWIRATFFAPNAAHRPRPKLRRIGDQLFTDDQLWQQFENSDPERRALAIEVIDALANLAEVRARKRRSHFLIERHAVYDIGLLNADLDGNDRELYDAAVQAWDEVTHLAALIECETNEPSEEDRRWARAVGAGMQEKIAEARSSAKAERGESREAQP
ncbi:MAG: hypothetical protein AB7T06_37505 [Kofleriaceae bacterium]